MRMVLSENILADGQQTLEQRFGVAVTLLRGELRRQVLESAGGFLMVRRKSCFQRRQCPPAEHLGLGVPPLLVVQGRKPDQGFGNIGMVEVEHPLFDVEGAFVEFFRLVIGSAHRQNIGQLSQCAGDREVLAVERGFLNSENGAIKVFRFRRPALCVGDRRQRAQAGNQVRMRLSLLLLDRLVLLLDDRDRAPIHGGGLALAMLRGEEFGEVFQGDGKIRIGVVAGLFVEGKRLAVQGFGFRQTAQRMVEHCQVVETLRQSRVGFTQLLGIADGGRETPFGPVIFALPERLATCPVVFGPAHISPAYPTAAPDSCSIRHAR